MFRFEPGTLTPTIINSTITHNSVGIYVHANNYNIVPNIIYNNIHDNSEYNIKLDEETENEINATYNWWGTTDKAAINQTIYDFKYDCNLPKVNFVPFLTEPNPETASKVIPEIPSCTILPLLLTATFLMIICSQKLPKTANTPQAY